MKTDVERYKTLLQRHQKLIWWLCFNQSPTNSMRCEDLVQETCITLWEHFGTLPADASSWEETLWVEQRTRDTLRSQRRHHRRQPQLVNPPDGLEHLAAHDDAAEARERVQELLSSLPEEDRRLMQMRNEGYNAREIGQALGIEPNAVYQRAFRILARLKKNETKQTKKG